jgi:hypothetical protein
MHIRLCVCISNYACMHVCLYVSVCEREKEKERERLTIAGGGDTGLSLVRESAFSIIIHNECYNKKGGKKEEKKNKELLKTKRSTK